MTDVQGHCPMGCGETLFLGAGGYITCGYLPCPQPDAANRILQTSETEHVVTFRTESFSIIHPLQDRLDTTPLDHCHLHEYLESLDGPPVQPGTYRAIRFDGRWRWEPTA